MKILSPVAGYIVRLNLPNGDAEELSGFDCDDCATALRHCTVLLRWLRGGVLYSHALPADTVEDVADLPACLARRGFDVDEVGVEVVEAGSREVVWCEADGDPNATQELSAAVRLDAAHEAPAGPRFVDVRAERK